MPTENWYPVSIAEHDYPAGMNDFTNNGGANKNASTRVGGGRTGPATHDDDTSYIRRTWSAGTEEQALNIDWPSPMVSVLASSTFNANGRHRVSGSTRRLARFTNSGGTHGTAWLDVTNSAGTYANTGPVDVSTAATYRPGGGSWVLADFDDDKSLFVTCQITSGDVLFTSIWGDIKFTAPAGGYVFLLNLVGAAALPFIGHMDFAQFRQMLDWRRLYHKRHTKMTLLNEARIAYEDYKNYKWPTYFGLKEEPCRTSAPTILPNSSLGQGLGVQASLALA